VSEVVEETSTSAEQHRNDVELELVQQSRRQVPVRDLSAAHSMTSLPLAAFSAWFGEDLTGDSVAVESARCAGVSLDLDERFHDLFWSSPVAERDAESTPQ
jgi:hypothetical protein